MKEIILKFDGIPGSNIFRLEFGNVLFSEVSNGVDGCYFTNKGMETDEMGIPYYTQSFVIGFDDLVDYLPGRVVKLRIPPYPRNFRKLKRKFFFLKIA